MKKIIHTLIVLCVAMAVHAQDNKPDSLANNYLTEVVVSANRWEQNALEIPSHIATVNKAAIQFQNPQTAADLLNLSNQVFIQKSQLGGGSPMIRGFATNRVLLVVDGVRMNNAIFRGGNVQNVISLDANAIQETEVIFGPGSVIYGSDAIGGVMDFHTLRPELSTKEGLLFKANALARYSSANNERTIHADFNIGLKQWAFTTSATKSIYDNLMMGSKGPSEYTRPDYQVRDGANDITVTNPDPNEQVNSGYNQQNFMQKVSFQPSGNLLFTYAFHFSETSDVPRYDRLILRNSATNLFTSAEWYYGPQQWKLHSFNVLLSKPTLLYDQLKVTVGYQDYSESRHNRNFTGGNRNRRTERFENVKALSANLDVDKQLGSNTSLFYGAEFVTNAVGSTARRVDITNGQESTVSTRYPDGSEWRSIAAYTSLRHSVGERITLTGSARYTHVYTFAQYDTSLFDFPFTNATLNNGSLNGSAGVSFKLNNQSKVYANISTGFRAPNVDDIGRVFDSQPGSVVVPNPNLTPETAYNAEVGYSGKLAEKVFVDGALYYTYLDNAIVRGEFTFNGQDSIDYDGTLSNVLALQNTSSIRIAGLQVGLRVDFTDALRFESRYNLQQGEEKDPVTGAINSPTHVAPSFGSTHVSYFAKNWRAVAYVNYNGSIQYNDLALTERADAHLYAKDADGNPYAPSWATLNAKASYTYKVVTVDVGIENILDKRYRPYSSGITAPGRNFIVSLRAQL
jgi:hemoglobin/transferrin/lactoferrin receptor protein